VCVCVCVCVGYYAMLESSSGQTKRDLSQLHRHLLDMKTQLLAMSSGSVTAGSTSRQSDDRLPVTARQSDSSTLVATSF